MACKWIKELVEREKDADFQLVYTQFYEQTFTSNKEVASTIQSEGFETFQVMMCKLNEHAKLLKRTDFANGVVSSVNQYG